MRTRILRIATTALVAAATLAHLATAANAAHPEQLIQFPSDGSTGSAAGRLDNPTSLAASPVSGSVFVVNRRNSRIDEFTAWGEFIRGFGWNVNASSPEEKLQVCTDATGCKKGSQGTGPGQFALPAGGIAIDNTGNIYAGDLENYRVQKFGPSGEFLLAFGSEGTSDGQFIGLGIREVIGVSPDGESVYVANNDRIQEFGADGSFKGKITFQALHEELNDFPSTGNATAFTVDAVTGVLYIAVQHSAPPFQVVNKIFKIDPGTGQMLGFVASPVLKSPGGLAVDSDSNLYVVNEPVPSLDSRETILKFDSAGNQLLPDKDEMEALEKEEEELEKLGYTENPFEFFSEPTDETHFTSITTNGACESEVDDFYVGHYTAGSPSLSYVKAYGPPPQNAVKCPPPAPGVPEVASQYATSVGIDSAVLGAEINPRYALDATYYVQYGTDKCSEGGCTSERPLPPGSSLTKKVSNDPQATGGIFLSNLESGTTYHYRFVAQSSGGGPVQGAEETFTTFATPHAPPEGCPNQAFRTGPSALLPDCRSYEIVSPLDRSPAGDIISVGHGVNQPAEHNQSAADGDKLAYSAEFAFADAIGAPATNEYIASRKAGQGWSTHAISPAQGQHRTNGYANLKLDTEEKGFTEDLCTSWLMHVYDPPLTGDAIEGYTNLYKRNSCGPEGESYESVSAPEAPITVGSPWAELQGFSTDGARSVFRADAPLTSDAPDLGKSAYNGGELQVYWESQGTLRFVCRLPNGSPYIGGCSAGTRGFVPEGRRSTVSRAVSSDGQRVYWSANSGPLYLRENAGEEQSAIAAGKCIEEEKACTYPVSSTGVGIQYWTAATDGSIAFYSEGEKLREYSAESRKSTTIAQKVKGVADASEDGSVVYFASTEQIGGEGEAGKPNLYLRQEGVMSLVGTLSESDMAANPDYFAIGPVDPRPRAHGARVTPNGQHLLFASNASLTGYDNRDVMAGRNDGEVFLYDAGSAGPVCISCNPSGARPLGRQFLGANGQVRGIAALIPGANSQLYAPRALSDDGNRVFFESFEALVARDTNGKRDVYEWQRSADQADCEAINADQYVESSGGCLSLISSGESPADSEFVDASTDGHDVFIRTAASLVPDDPGLIDIYDARIGGGFAPKAPIPPSCEGEACQSPPAPPNDPTPASSSFQGAGNVVEKPAKKKRKKKARKKAQKKQKHNRQRRTTR